MAFGPNGQRLMLEWMFNVVSLTRALCGYMYPDLQIMWSRLTSIVSGLEAEYIKSKLKSLHTQYEPYFKYIEFFTVMWRSWFRVHSPHMRQIVLKCGNWIFSPIYVFTLFCLVVYVKYGTDFVFSVSSSYGTACAGESHNQRQNCIFERARNLSTDCGSVLWKHLA